MNSTFGTAVRLSLFGESHGPGIGVVIDGLAPGLAIDTDFIASQMEKRRPAGLLSTARREEDRVELVSGCFNGHTTGAPLCMLIRNENQHSGDYEKTRYLARPSHADYCAQQRFGGFQDYRGGGHFSGRLTAPIVAAGAVLMQLLRREGIEIGSHILRCAQVCDCSFASSPQALREQMQALNEQKFATLDPGAGQAMRDKILQAKEQGDSVGGEIETAVIGLPVGLGEPFFDSVESVLSHLLFSIPAVKGVSFGDGFAFADHTGSAANDPLRMEGEKVVTQTNRNGGVNGGLTNAMPVLIHTAVKPTPSIYKEQKTVDMRTGSDALLTIKGRHDPAIVHRARVVVDSMVAIGLAELLARKSQSRPLL